MFLGMVSISHLSAGHLPSPPPLSSPSAARSLPSSQALWAGPGRVASVHEVKILSKAREIVRNKDSYERATSLSKYFYALRTVMCLLLELKLSWLTSCHDLHWVHLGSMTVQPGPTMVTEACFYAWSVKPLRLKLLLHLTWKDPSRSH